MGKNNNTQKYPCPCCGYLMFEEGPGSLEICTICFWQDDIIDLEQMYEPAGPNKLSLEKSQINFAQLGAVEERFVEHVRSVSSESAKESNWRVLDRSKDIPRDIKTDSVDFKELYYWYWSP